ncbi:hypothetical protein [Kribbella sp. NPDC003557]|uniref:hypothetical protein n=1 Tax=Kribbella sp. NPDC003557 TaxID=3154449 RepID=UPI0033B6DD17
MDGMASEAHLQLIQGVINRLSSQSTTVKGWCVTVTAALLGFGATSATPIIALVAAYVIAAFALIDAKFLSLERGFRRLYRQAVDGNLAEWSLETERPRATDILRALFGLHNMLLYGSSLVVTAAVGIYLTVNRT